jgi:hypothetical protein
MTFLTKIPGLLSDQHAERQIEPINNQARKSNVVQGLAGTIVGIMEVARELNDAPLEIYGCRMAVGVAATLPQRIPL